MGRLAGFEDANRHREHERPSPGRAAEKQKEGERGGFEAYRQVTPTEISAKASAF